MNTFSREPGYLLRSRPEPRKAALTATVAPGSYLTRLTDERISQAFHPLRGTNDREWI